MSSIERLHTPFFGFPVKGRVSRINNGNSILLSKRKFGSRDFPKFFCEKQNWFSQLSLRSVEFLSRKNSILKMNYSEEHFSRSKALVRSFGPLWKEGLVLVRCSVIVAVISALGMLVWYLQVKAKRIVEARVLPSVCSAMSEYLQREIDPGKVRMVSPLSITLESCSIGPYHEEFSNGEVPRMKIRVKPFSSLRRGKIVVDAVLLRPNVLVVQKEDFSWLGIPSPSDGAFLRHSSTEEGIDYRTKSRRMAREEAAFSWTKERDEEARTAAEKGYIVPQQSSISSSHVDLVSLDSLFCIDDKMHWKDHHCMDTSGEHNVKHINVEKSKSSDTKIVDSRVKLWTRMIPGSAKHGFKRKDYEKDNSAANYSAKRRNLERSAKAVLAYFQGRKYGDPSQCGKLLSNGASFEILVGKSDDVSYTLTANRGNSQISLHKGDQDIGVQHSGFNFMRIPFVTAVRKLSSTTEESNGKSGNLEGHQVGDSNCNSRAMFDPLEDKPLDKKCSSSQGKASIKLGPWLVTHHSFPIWSLSPKPGLPSFAKSAAHLISDYMANHIQKLKSCMNRRIEDLVLELAEGIDQVQPEGIEKMLPVTLDSVHFSGGTLMLLGYGDREPREMENVNGYVKFQNHYSRIYVQLSGRCKEWRSDLTSEDGGCLSVDVFVDTVEQKWSVNLKIINFFVPLFERILEIPITWSKGRATGELHICMTRGEEFPNLHGQLDVAGLAFQILDSPSGFSDLAASLCFRGQRVFLHNASGWFGDVPLEASGDFGINPEDGEFHLMCQVLCVEVNSLMKTFRMKPLLFPVAGSITAVFNCQGPLDAPIFVGSGIVSRKTAQSVSEFPTSSASEAVLKNKEAGAVAAFDRIPFSYVSANFTFNTDNNVADLYGIRATLLDGGEIRGAGNAWISPEGEEDDTAMDVNFSGNVDFDKVMHRYLPTEIQAMPLKIGEVIGETKLSGSLLRP
ncbi:hypothetical protein GIB67_030460 [Kingdonia uniflora]|uniref:Uncharacterized protein n=1 Tax=Kingdonia uniflora TaxID=39325 RepID=A0A7J7P7J6_9MAGN|nr:hypothetical protein GIB67_030460 [Kingdonia uniflora]